MERSKLRVETPCEKRWAELEGSGAARHCEACALHVIDGSALTKTQAESMVRDADASGERLCMRMLVDKSGAFVHAAEPCSLPEVPQGSAWKSLSWTAGVVASTALVACGDDAPQGAPEGTLDPPAAHELPVTEPQPERPPEILGSVCYVGEGDEPLELETEAAQTAGDPQFTKEQLSEMMGGMRIEPVEPPPADPLRAPE